MNTRRHREMAAEVARATASDLAELECVAPTAVAEARLRRRLAGGRDASDATPDVAAAMAIRFDPWPVASVVDTAAPLRLALDTALAAVGSAVGT